MIIYGHSKQKLKEVPRVKDWACGSTEGSEILELKQKDYILLYIFLAYLSQWTKRIEPK
jgi:hypothetical protein